jgi:predicted ATPase
MIIKRIYAKNYRSIAEVNVNLDSLTVLVGPNGSGKSNFIDIFRFISDALKKGIQSAIDERQGIKAIRRWAPRRPYDIEIELEMEGNFKENQDAAVEKFVGKYRIEIKSIKSSESDGFITYGVKRESCECVVGNEKASYEVLNGKWIKKPKGIEFEPDVSALVLPLLFIHPFSLINFFLRYVNIYNIYPDSIRTPVEPLADYPLDSKGRNIASVLRRMQRGKSKWISDIKEALEKVVPGIADIHVKPVGGFLTLRFTHMYGVTKPHDFEASQESDGTLRMLGILVALFQEPSPNFIAIEEPEITVHPGVLETLAELIKEASEKRSQVIITTHSPDLISQFSPKHLRIVDWNSEDGTTIASVDESQLEIINQKLFSSGDLLRIEGLRQKKSLDE